MKKLVLYGILLLLMVQLVTATPWFNASCKTKRNISLSDITGTQTINLTISGSSLFDVTKNGNSTNFTFTDASEATKLQFIVDYINASGTPAQEVQFFVNISNNNTIWMYYDCSFAQDQGTYTTGDSSPVMLYYQDFHQGVEVSSCGSMVVENTTTIHGSRRTREALQTPNDHCVFSGELNYTSGNALDFINIEAMVLATGDLLSWLTCSNLADCGINTDTQLFLRHDDIGNEWEISTNTGGATVIRTYNGNDHTSWHRFKINANFSQNDPTVFTYMNGTSDDSFPGGFRVPGTGIDVLRFYYGIGYIDEIKIWAMNPNTAITIGQPIIESESADENAGRSAIEQAILGSLSGVTILTDHTIHVRLSNGSQYAGVFDKAVEKGNQFWAFNYVTGNESSTRIPGLKDVLFIWENQSLTTADVTQQAGMLINTTKV